MRGLIDRRGEQFGYFQGDVLYTLDDVATGRIEDEYIVDMAGKRIWRIVGDAVYALDGSDTIGYIGDEISDQFAL